MYSEILVLWMIRSTILSRSFTFQAVFCILLINLNWKFWIDGEFLQKLCQSIICAKCIKTYFSRVGYWSQNSAIRQLLISLLSNNLWLARASKLYFHNMSSKCAFNWQEDQRARIECNWLGHVVYVTVWPEVKLSAFQEWDHSWQLFCSIGSVTILCQ